MEKRGSTPVTAVLGRALYATPIVPLLFVPGSVRIVAGVAAGAIFVRLITRVVNHRDARDSVAANPQHAEPAATIILPTGFRVLRAAFVATAFWCTTILATALYVRVPDQGRPGTHFSNDVAPAVLRAMADGLGASRSRRPERPFDTTGPHSRACAAGDTKQIIATLKPASGIGFPVPSVMAAMHFIR